MPCIWFSLCSMQSRRKLTTSIVCSQEGFGRLITSGKIMRKLPQDFAFPLGLGSKRHQNYSNGDISQSNGGNHITNVAPAPQPPVGPHSNDTRRLSYQDLDTINLQQHKNAEKPTETDQTFTIIICLFNLSQLSDLMLSFSFDCTVFDWYAVPLSFAISSLFQTPAFSNFLRFSEFSFIVQLLFKHFRSRCDEFRTSKQSSQFNCDRMRSAKKVRRHRVSFRAFVLSLFPPKEHA